MFIEEEKTERGMSMMSLKVTFHYFGTKLQK
jgi:hypothetical protein